VGTPLVHAVPRLALYVLVLWLAASASSHARADHTSNQMPGYDISWPQCGKSYPSPPIAFAIIGINNGRPYTANPCFLDEYNWARKFEPNPAVYINTDFPKPGRVEGNTGPFGTCEPTDDWCRAYNYGYGIGRDVTTIEKTVSFPILLRDDPSLFARHPSLGFGHSRERLELRDARLGQMPVPAEPRDRLTTGLRRSCARRQRGASATLGGPEFRSRTREALEPFLEPACVAPRPGCQIAISQGRAFELVDPGQHPGEGPRTQQHGDGLGLAVGVETTEEGRDPGVRGVERGADDRDVRPRTLERRLEREPSSLEPRGLTPRARDRRLGCVQLEDRGALGCDERDETGIRGRRSGGRSGRAAEERYRHARHEISRTPPHRAKDRTRRIRAVCRDFRVSWPCSRRVALLGSPTCGR